MPTPPFDFNVQQNFPISSVIQAAQENANRQQRAQEYGNQQFVEGLQAIGNVGQSLLDRRRAMAQAMAGAQYIAAKNPELFQPTSTTTQAPVPASQTASFDPNTGTVTPNTGTAGAVTTRPQTTTAPPQMDMHTMATALLGTPFNDILKTGFEQHKLDIDTGLRREQLGIEARKATAEQQRMQIEDMIRGLLAKNTVGNDALMRQQESDKTALEANKETSKHWFLHPLDAFAANKAIAAQGGATSYQPILPEVGKTIVHPSGVKITRTK